MARRGSARAPSAPRVDPAALGDTESLFRLAMERSAIGMCLLGPEGTFLTVNPALCAMLDRTSDELLASTWQQLTHPDDLDADLALVAEVVEGRRDHYRLLKRYLRPDGSVLWGDLSVGVVRDAAGSVLFFVSQIVDMTDLVGAREALARSELHYRLLAEHSSDVIVRTDAERTIIWASPSALDTLGWEPAALVGRVVDEFVHPDDVDRERAGLEHPADFPGGIDAVRVRRADGSFAWVSGRARPLGDPADGNVVALRDVTERVVAQHARHELDARYRLLAEYASDVVCEVDEHATIRWVSPSVESVLGWRPADLVGTLALDLVDAADRAVAEGKLTEVFAGLEAPDIEMRVRRADGETRWMMLRGGAMRDPADDIVAAVVGLRDCQAEVVLRRAARTHAVAESILARATSEDGLLADMCQATVDEAGYLLAWYARRIDDPDRSVEFVARSRAHADYLDQIRITWDDGPLGQGPTGRTLRTGTTTIFQDLAQDAAFAPWIDAARDRGFRSSLSVPVLVNGRLDGAFSVCAPEPRAFDEAAVTVLEDFARQLGFGIAKMRDARALAESVRQSRLLGSVVEQAAEAIVVTDPTASIIYANPAAERSSGYSFDEMAGHNPRIFQSGIHTHAHYEALWSQLISGEPWRGVLVNRRKSGEVYEESATIAPVHDTDGSLVAYVAIKRDLTRERDLEAVLTRDRSDQETLVEVMDRVHTGESLDEVADEFCNAACLLDGVDRAAVLLVQPDDSLLTVGAAPAHDSPFVSGFGLAFEPASDWRAEVAGGRTWYVDLDDPERPRTSALAGALRERGITAAAVIPIWWDRTLTGVVTLLTSAPEGAARLETRSVVLDEIGALATSLLGFHLVHRREREATLTRIRAYIDERRFRVAYQPVVDIATGAIHGYEALTRFDDGSDPQRTFTDAHAVGLGVELEIACLRLAIDDAPGLPPDAWLSVNLSPTTILDGRAGPHLTAPGRQLVLEITEHTAIQDYPRLRSALAALRGVWLSVDDAGAGYASMRHILELRPQIVKLDLGLVHHVDTDPVRQGLAAGLSHFAAQTGTMLVAEGVETAEEAQTLRDLGIIYAQGFLYGRPAPLE